MHLSRSISRADLSGSRCTYSQFTVCIDIVAIAKACGYPNTVSVDSFDDLDKALEDAKSKNELSLIEVKCSIGAREDLGRPTTTAIENKVKYMHFINLL